ncbi:MAG: 50S ribosomal protein L24 [Candidatus Nanoarchaeia archaeon]|nr:50S ribosomal protein L24 [Candidatus Nanoarchaeia archaeon]MDD5239660.1 50S ribosomal protein L24 [Candidatus Nanoarchaeia archaeon]
MKSSKPRKQRKQIYSRNISVLKRAMHAHLSKALREKYQKRSFGVKKDDTVKIVRGKFRGKDGKIERVNLEKQKVYVEGIQKAKADGTFSKLGIHPSNVIIIELDLKDKLRKEMLEGKTKAKETAKEKPKKGEN